MWGMTGCALPWCCRSVNYLFEQLERSEADYTVRVSFLELYNEELQVCGLLCSTTMSPEQSTRLPCVGGLPIGSGLELLPTAAGESGRLDLRDRSDPLAPCHNRICSTPPPRGRASRPPRSPGCVRTPRKVGNVVYTGSG
jgi:hypothetical protein